MFKMNSFRAYKKPLVSFACLLFVVIVIFALKYNFLSTKLCDNDVAWCGKIIALTYLGHLIGSKCLTQIFPQEVMF